MALRCPFAEWRPLGPQTEPLMTSHDLLILHTAVGYLSSTDRYFRTDGYSGPESHYGIGGRWGGDLAANLDGALYQWQDRRRQADANVQANPRAISVETADNAPASAADIAPWTARQQDMLVRLIRWECSTAAHADCPPAWTCHREGIPMVLVPDSTPGRRGIGYHRQGIDPWRVAGGETWSASRGKECPGPARITQIPALIERARSGGQGGFTLSEAQDILDAIARLRQDATVFGTTGFEQTMEQIATRQRDTLARLGVLDGRLDSQQRQIDALAQAYDKLAALVGAGGSGGAVTDEQLTQVVAELRSGLAQPIGAHLAALMANGLRAGADQLTTGGGLV